VTSFGPFWPSAVPSPPPDELLVEIAGGLGIVLTAEQARALLERVDGGILPAAVLLERMRDAHLRREAGES